MVQAIDPSFTTNDGSIVMNFRVVDVAVVFAIATALAGCTASPGLRVATAQSASSQAHLDGVTTPENCPAFDDRGSGAYVRHFGDTTPWSENPFLNPCWPN
jgi:hypothetical protein